MAESVLTQKRRRVYFRMVGKDRGIVRVICDLDAKVTFLIKKDWFEKLFRDEIDVAYATETPDSKEWENQRKGYAGRRSIPET
jgi:hypothetical protein